MWKPKEVASEFKIIPFITFTLFITLTISNYGISTVGEGDVTSLSFSYPCESTKVTLQHGNGAPFYTSTNPEYSPLSSNLKLINQNNSDSNVCYIKLTISPVLRTNEGTYILFAYKNGVKRPHFLRIGLRVDYPPGKASCERLDEYVDGEWVKLYCSAPVGSLAGQIVCYQNGIKLPPSTLAEENEGILTQIVLTREEQQHVYCCSSAFQQTRDRCECQDWEWDPVANIPVTDIRDPCHETSPTQVLPSLQTTRVNNHDDGTTSSLSETTKTGSPENVGTERVISWPYLILISIVANILLTVFIAVVIIIVKRSRLNV